MRLVLDTNIFVLALWVPGPEREILRAWRQDRFQLFTSKRQLAEIAAVGRKKTVRAQIAKVKFDALEVRLKTSATVFSRLDVKQIVQQDLTDDWIIAIALKAGAHILSSNDSHLLSIEILRNKTFTAILNAEQTLKKLRNQ